MGRNLSTNKTRVEVLFSQVTKMENKYMDVFMKSHCRALEIPAAVDIRSGYRPPPALQ